MRASAVMRPVAAVAGLVLALSLPCGAARGERSYSLPESVEPVPAGTTVVRAPIWSHASDDAPDNGHDVLAIGGGTVAFAAGDALCGYRETDGARRLCVSGGTAPAYAAGQVAYSARGGGSASVDAADGRMRWRHRVAALARVSSGTRGAAAYHGSPAGEPDVEEVWSTGTDFLARSTSRGVLAEISTTGKPLWSSQVEGNRQPLIAAPYAFFAAVEDGAIISTSQQVVRLGPGGSATDCAAGRPSRFGCAEAARLVDISTNSFQIAAVHPPYAFVTVTPNEEVEDHVLTVDVARVDLHTGRADHQFHFEPDYDTLYSAFVSNSGDASEALVRVDDSRVYFTLLRNVYRYEFSEPSAQHPLLVSRDAKLLGGPYHGAVFVKRHDGVWLLRPEAHAIRARLVAPSLADVMDFAILGRTAYVAFGDGVVRGFDADSGRPRLDAQPCDGSAVRIGTSRRNVYIVCPTTGPFPGSRVFAFARSEGGTRSDP